MPELTSATPVEIDTFLAANWEEQAKANRKLAWAKSAVRRIAGQKQDRRTKLWNGTLTEAIDRCSEIAQVSGYAGNQFVAGVEEVVEGTICLEMLTEEAIPYEAEYTRRPWNRYFIVRNSNGHVHRERNCSTCYSTTVYGWIVELADASEEALVAEYGELACTVCFPSAPTFKGFGDGTSAIARFSTAEKEARAAEKAEKDALKAAKNLVEPVRLGRWTITTIYSAKQELKSFVERNIYYGEEEERTNGIQVLSAALARRDIDVAPLIAKWTKAANKEANR
jgi:hypothetical protein